MLTKQYSSTNFITGLRAIAIFMVFLIHSGGGSMREMFSFGDRVIDMGKYGVDIFFVISGFTIFYQFYNRNYSLKNFFAVRLLRVSIPYFPIILGIYFYVLFGGVSTNYWAISYNNGEISLSNLIAHLLYISYIKESFANTILSVEWTLAIEVFFYIVFGVIIASLKKFDTIKETFFLVVLFFFISIFGLFISKYLNSSLLYQWMPFKYGYMFLLGGLAYHLREKLTAKLEFKKLNFYSNITILFAIASFLFFLTMTKIPNIGVINELFFALWTFILILFIQDSAKFSKVLTNKVIVSIGSISFSMYLLHMLIIKSSFLQIDSLVQKSSLNFLYLLCVTILLSTLYYWVFEVKIYRTVKSRWKK